MNWKLRDITLLAALTLVLSWCVPSTAQVIKGSISGISSSRSNNFSNTNGVGFSVNGLRGRSNDQQIDGQNNNSRNVTAAHRIKP